MAEPDLNTTPNDDHPPAAHHSALPRPRRSPAGLHFWTLVWIGTTAAGGTFGLLVAGPIGLFFGCSFAAIIAVPIHVTLGTLTWLFRMSRFRVTLAGLAGGLTGILAAGGVSSSDLLASASDLPLLWAIGLAGLMGALGAALAGGLHCLRGRSQGDAANALGSRDWRITHSDILVCVGVLAVLLTVWLRVSTAARLAQEKEVCADNLRLIAFILSDYRTAHGCLPPAYVTDPNGRPVLSWRVLVAKQIRYDGEFSSEIDFSQPWDSPRNSPFLNEFPAEHVFQCPAAKDTQPGTTDYVAVVGPGTPWPGKEPGKVPAGKNPILVVEWPQSDIHWAEPRDISVEQFLDRFRSKTHPPSSNHRGFILYIDAKGNVGELRDDTDLATVRRLLAGDEPTAP